MHFTSQQWLAMAVGLCAVLAGSGSAAQLTELFGGSVAGDIAAACGLLGGILTIPLTMLSGQGAQIQSVVARIDEPAVKQQIIPAVANLPGVQSITTNAHADPTVAALAASNAPANSKIEEAK